MFYCTEEGRAINPTEPFICVYMSVLPVSSFVLDTSFSYNENGVNGLQ